MPHNFKLIKKQNIAEMKSLVSLYRHNKTGAQLLSVVNDDENKVFSMNFRTPPVDSTGMPHILEHSVLGGSEKYPVKEPFVELVKGSLATFVNAMTYPDKTVYPVASQNIQDFYNLIDVYVDAVLHPLITEETLMQEGWHYELNDLKEPLTYKGVVFNEMKGVYSDPDSLLETAVYQSLFPKHIYGHDYGGDPRVIPELTYKNFVKFHKTLYHPSNSFIFFYGNDDPDARLKLMNGYLSGYKASKVKSKIPELKPFKKPRVVEIPYQVDADADLSKKHYITINWVLPDKSDAVLAFSMNILGHILIGTSASPLRKALIDSGLGEDLAGGGMETSIRENIFSTGLKGIHAEDGEKVEQLIFDTLEKLAREGIDPDTIAASINTTEFRLRENNTGGFPRGLSAMLRAMTTWLYDDSPFKLLAFEKPFGKMKEKLAKDKFYFEKLIRKYLLNNPYRSILRLTPDPELGQRIEADEKARLAKAQKKMSAKKLNQVLEETRLLKEHQEMPNSPEALATLPMLKLEDLDKQNKYLPLEVIDYAGVNILYHDLFTNGILYFDIGFDMRALPQDLLPMMSIFGRALMQLGTQTEDYVKLSQRIGKSTGGIHTATVSSAGVGSHENVIKFFVSGKSTADKSSALLEIIKDILLTVNFDNRERFKQIVLESKSGLESGLVPSGHAFAHRRLHSQFTETGWVSEQIGGVDALFFLRNLADEIESNWAGVLAKLEAVRDTLVTRSGMICNVTLDSDNVKKFTAHLHDFIQALPDKPVSHPAWNFEPTLNKEGLAIPAQVNYVGKAMNLYKAGFEMDGSSEVVMNFLRLSYLWDKIRVQGGAYGAFCTFDDLTGVFAYLSYRDPNLAETLEHYNAAAGFLKNLDSNSLSEQELTKNIIGVIGDMDSYQLPDAKGYTSMMRYLIGRTDEMRQKRRDEILSTNGEDFISFGEALEKAAKEEAIAVIGSQSAIEGANIGLKMTKVL